MRGLLSILVLIGAVMTACAEHGTRAIEQPPAELSARSGNARYVVLLNAPSREADATALMDWAFGAFQWPAPAGALQ
jgi:hypothetical protein